MGNAPLIAVPSLRRARHFFPDIPNPAESDLDADHYENDRIELDRWVREQILLEAPVNPECPQGCAAPIQMPATEEKAERSVDPRLAPLQKFSKKR